jgi:5-methylcytosine-specific restriction endonuclease McrA
MTLPSSCRVCGIVGKSLCDYHKQLEDKKRFAVLSQQPHNREYDTTEYRTNRQTLIEYTWRFHIPCWICLQSFDSVNDISADHYIPLSRGGTNDISNLKPAHKQCNTHRGKGHRVELYPR